MTQPTTPKIKPDNLLVVIDDEAAILDLLKYFFEDQGFTVETFADPRRAIAYLEKNSPSLVLTDLRMPEMTGVEVCQWILKNRPGVPIVTMTGHSDADEELDRLGVRDRLKKPFKLRDVLEIISLRTATPLKKSVP